MVILSSGRGEPTVGVKCLSYAKSGAENPDCPQSMVSPAAPPVSNLNFQPRASTPDTKRNPCSKWSRPWGQNYGSNQVVSQGTGSKISDTESQFLPFFSVNLSKFLNTHTPHTHTRFSFLVYNHSSN